MRFQVFQVSRKGGREKNEDRMGYCYTQEAGLFALADGMGGHPEGEVAAGLALQAMAAIFQRDAKPVLADPLKYLQDAVLIGHRQLLRYAQDKKLHDTPRTTVVACVMQGHNAYWVHCGDSRLYLVRGGKLIARTRDHSYSELQEALGRPAPGAERFNRNVLFTCLGSPGKPMIDVSGPLVMEPGDKMLLCSDGLWGTVSDVDITAQLAARPIADAVPELVERALRNGGERCDNVTVLAVEWEGSELPIVNAAPPELTVDEDGFASTIQAGPGQVDARGAMDEEEIERSVREIQAVITQRSAAKKTSP
ncbi:PP2C family serine/threonine-protein phosphatase [Pelomonas sp. KK5]|uniref:PP2C family protein-serine/threonine phosphatase n=1 Tax=Pelomonas sp. KK5 TaxID=1855730 RepID=UPI00097CAECD|nr:PP2C family serine/threonine-protein phosphatase [Pelomonas sp. KK5]